MAHIYGVQDDIIVSAKIVTHPTKHVALTLHTYTYTTTTMHMLYLIINNKLIKLIVAKSVIIVNNAVPI